jgi:ferritin-like metal-binding protein YciE
MKRKVAFMFINGNVEKTQRQEMDLDQVLMIFIGVESYEIACTEARNLAEEGVSMIELCGGFGTLGHAMVAEAAGEKVQVGVVRFDNHPGYDNLSGDEKWLN